MKKLREAIDYGDYPERMDPKLEKILASPESLYAKNPAFRKGPEDVQRLAGERFKKVVDKLRQVKGLNEITPQLFQRIYMEEMQKLPMVMGIESRHREELEQLAIKTALDVTEYPEGWVEIEAMLNRQPIDVSDFRYKPEKEEKPKKQTTQLKSYDIEDLTDEEEFELEKHKRNLLNALVQGAAKKGHWSFQLADVKDELDAIDGRLYPAYAGIMAVNDYMYFSAQEMIEMMSRTGQGVAGKVKVQDLTNDDDDESEDEEGQEDKIETKIIAQGMIFPILVHEIIKGIEVADLRASEHENPELSQRVKSQVDLLSNEPMQLIIGPEVQEKVRFVLPDKLFETSNRGLINWFKIALYQRPSQEIIEVIGDAISKDEPSKMKASKKFLEILKVAEEMKSDFEEYQQEKGMEGPEDGLDDFLGSLGIILPK